MIAYNIHGWRNHYIFNLHAFKLDSKSRVRTHKKWRTPVLHVGPVHLVAYRKMSAWQREALATVGVEILKNVQGQGDELKRSLLAS